MPASRRRDRQARRASMSSPASTAQKFGVATPASTTSLAPASLGDRHWAVLLLAEHPEPRERFTRSLLKKGARDLALDHQELAGARP